jgi:transcriptional regulator with XRE-family HTH domain
MSMLLRDALGLALKKQRNQKHWSMRRVVINTGGIVSLGYISELERGKKEVSSEVLNLILSGLDGDLPQILRDTADILEGAR